MAHCVSCGQATPPPATRTHIQLNKRAGLLPVERRFLIPGSGSDLRRQQRPQPRPHPQLERSCFLRVPPGQNLICGIPTLFILISCCSAPCSDPAVEKPIKFWCNVKTMKRLNKLVECVLPDLLTIYWKTNNPDEIPKKSTVNKCQNNKAIKIPDEGASIHLILLASVITSIYRHNYYFTCK